MLAKTFTQFSKLRPFFLSAFLLFSTAFAQQGSDATGFTARLMNIEATAKETFRYNTTLKNAGGEAKVYALKADLPEGWNVIFRTEGSQVASVKVDAEKTRDISLEITASPHVTPGNYKIPVTASAPGETFTLELEASVKGAYSLELTTPTGRLSDDITEGKSKLIKLTVKNTGSLPLDGIELTAQSPSKWTASFEPAKIDRVEPGESQEVSATLQVPDKTIAGDYITTFTAKNNQVNATATFRMTVKTSLLSGWLGIMVILAALGIVYYLIRKYGRR